MFKEYHKIITVWKRDPATKYKTLIWGEWATPEFEYLQDAVWSWTEKVDGTNIRLTWADGVVRLDGRHQRSQIRGENGNRIHDQPAGIDTGPPERIDNLKPLG